MCDRNFCKTIIERFVKVTYSNRNKLKNVAFFFNVNITLRIMRQYTL